MKKERVKKAGIWKRLSLKSKGIIAAVLAVVVLASGLTGYFLMAHQAKAETYDRTQGDMRGLSAENVSSDDNKAGTAVFSDSVRVFVDSDADKINSAIKNVNVSNFGVEITTQGSTPLENLGTGDVFYLDGSKSTPFGEPYIGKIAEVGHTGENRVYRFETPKADEVFDKLKIDYDRVVKSTEIENVKTFEGVTSQKVDDIEKAIPMSTESEETAPSTLEYSNGTIKNRQVDKEKGSGDNLVFNVEVDLLKALNLDKDDGIFNEKYTEPSLEPGRIDVYVTDTGKSYHRENCGYLSRSKNHKTLREAINEDYLPCRVCKPPVTSENGDAFVKLEGKFGLETLDFDMNFDFDVGYSPLPVKDLSASCHGKFISEVKLSAGLSYEISGQKTKIEIGNFVKLEGLKEKLIPLVYVSFQGGTIATAFTQQSIRALTEMPVSLGAMIYVDIDGNITAQLETSFTYRREFSITANLIKDGNILNEIKNDVKDPEKVFKLKFDVSGDLDAHVGCSLMVYVFNLNLLDVSLVRIGAEAEGMLSCSVSNSDKDPNGNGVSSSFNIRGYVKIAGVTLNLKFKADLWLFDISKNLSFDFLWMDLTIFEYGTKSKTRFKPEIMGYSPVTANDGETIFYKSEDGKLMKEENGSRTVLYSKDFYTICGIDTSYIYVLKPSDEGGYMIYRISRETGTDKKIADEVKRCLMIDEDNIYYISNFDNKLIQKLSREKLKEETFMLMPEPVTFMAKQDSDFYVVTQPESIFILFSSPSKCYLVSKVAGKPTITQEYGDDPPVENFYRERIGKYMTATRMVSAGDLRNTASTMYWMSSDGTKTVETKGISGWNDVKEGIFTTQDNDAGTLPYKIVLYSAADGSERKVLEANSDQAFFTLCKANNNEWYYMDQTDTELILYVTDSNFGSKKEIKRFSLSEMQCSLDKSSMLMINNRCYFYTIPDDETCEMLYRFDIV